MSRFAIAMAAYAALMLLAWETLSDMRIRLATVAVLALLAFKTALHRRKAQAHRSRQAGPEADRLPKV